MKPLKNIVLVHGAFADGSSWAKVIAILQAKGYNVTAVQNPLTSFADDVAATNRALASQDGPVILVGHSWGGVVITEAGMDPKVVGLVYVAAFAPDEGEVTCQRGLAFGYLPQENAPVADETVIELATGVTPEYIKLRRILKAWEADHPVEALHPEEIHDDVHNRFNELGGYRLEAKAKQILAGLSFREKDFERRANEMSSFDIEAVMMITCNSAKHTSNNCWPPLSTRSGRLPG